MFPSSLRIAIAALDRPTQPADWLRIVEGLRGDPGFWWLDSALPGSRLGRHSFAGADPYLWLHARGRNVEIDVRRAVWPGLSKGVHRIVADPIDSARSLLPRTDSAIHSTRTMAASGDPGWRRADGSSTGLELPFVGGAVGYFGYELARTIERQLCFENADALGLPDLSLAFVDQVLGYDHASERLWIVGMGFGDARSSDSPSAVESAVARSRIVVDELAIRIERTLSGAPSLRPPRDRPKLPKPCRSFDSTVDASGYAKAVDRILEEIGAGNVYQANFSQRLSIDAPVDPWRIYMALRKHNPAPFGCYLSLPDAAVLSSSPERFLRLDSSRQIESRPIKGTRPRGDDDIEDARLAAELASSEKDRAENLMIVDLVRNDLGRVCTPGSIGVPELMSIEAYASVFQMVSTVTGTLASGRDAFDLVRATFPPGSMTGAPKLASIALLEDLESVRRGVYAGALGYLDLRGGLDLSVVIRTIIWKEGRAHLHVGGGVVADSSPQAEYLESLDKAKAPLAALDEALRGRQP